MTVREIAAFVGKTERAVRKWIAKAAEKSSAVAEKSSAAGHGRVVDYTIDEVEAILQASTLSRDAVAILMGNARRDTTNVLAPTGPSTLTDRDMQIIGGIVSQVFAQLSERMGRVEGVVERRAALLPAPQKEPRSELSQLVRTYARAKTGNDFHQAWNELYTEMLYRLHINVRVRAKNEGVKPIDYLEREGMLETACSIVSELIGATA